MRRQLIAGGILVAMILFIQACGRRPEPQVSCHFVQNSQQQRVSWKGNLPVKLYLHSSVPVRDYLAIGMAIEEWTRILGREYFRIELTGVSGPSVPSQDGSSMIYWLHSWEAGRRNEQARTTVYWTGDRINEADVRVNAANFSLYSGDGTEIFSGVDVTSLMVHELGHVLGLAHITEKPSVMAVSLASGSLRRVPTKVDLEALQCEY
ncbi:MAG: matrixin family metalloprotease [Bdellovibrionales bacterium]|nr:matrixin family metalloprotease [Bdellovibrionales bacterium]